jgi:uncharacterized protein (TIGR00369 family)
MKKAIAGTPDVEHAAFFGIDVPFMRHIGLLPERLEPGLARTRLPLQEELLNSRGDVHGGTLMSALDFTLSAAARSHDPLATGVITVEMSTHFLGAARTDLVFEASTIRRGSRIVFCEGEARDEHGNAVCVARATFKLVHAKVQAQTGLPAGPRQAETPLP